MRRLRVRFRGYTVAGDAASFAHTGQAASFSLGLPTVDGAFTLAQSNMDATTWTSYSAALTASERAAIVVAALSGTVVVEVVDGVGNVRASGTMLAPWAIASSSTITVGEVADPFIVVASGGVPASGWVLRFRSGTRFVQGSFGVAGSGEQIRWSLATFATGGKATIGAVAITAAQGGAGAGPTLLSGITVNTWRAADAGKVGAVLTLDQAVWQYEDGVVLNGTIGAGDVVGPTQLRLPAGADAFPDFGTGGGWYILLAGFPAYDGNTGQYSEVTAYNPGTRVATVNWPTVAHNPPVGRAWYALRGYPVARAFQWFRDGVAIDGQVDRVYTTTAADIGKSITVREYAGNISRTNPGDVPEIPAVQSISLSAPFVVSGSATDHGLIGGMSDFTMIGSWRSNAGWGDPNSGSLCVIPAAYSPNGQRAMLIKGARNYGSYAMTNAIPADGSLSNIANHVSLPQAQVINPSGTFVRLLNGQEGEYSGLPTGVLYNDWGFYHLPGTDRVLCNEIGSYTYEGIGLFWRRNVNIENLTDVEGPFVPIDTVAPMYNSRWQGGSICQIPPEWQSALGGDVLLTSGAASIHSNNSDGPGCMSIDSSTISGAISKNISGTARGGTSNTIQLALDASSVDGFYVNCHIWIVNDGLSVGEKKIYRITGYVGSTRTATIAGTFIRTVNASSTYRIYGFVAGRQLCGYTSPMATADARGQAPIWYTTNSDNACAFFPRGSNSVVFIATSLFGTADYGLAGKISNNGLGLIYDPYSVSSSPSNRNANYFADRNFSIGRAYVYDANDLAAVYAGSRTFTSVLPRAVFAFKAPYLGGYIAAASFDNTTGRLYIAQLMPSKVTVFTVYQCNKWS